MMDLNDRQNAIKYFEAQRDCTQKFLKAIPKDTVAYHAYILEIEYLNLAIEAITALDDLWQTQTFKSGWEEGFGMGKQELAHRVMKIFEEEGV